MGIKAGDGGRGGAGRQDCHSLQVDSRAGRIQSGCDLEMARILALRFRLLTSPSAWVSTLLTAVFASPQQNAEENCSLPQQRQRSRREPRAWPVAAGRRKVVERDSRFVQISSRNIGGKSCGQNAVLANSDGQLHSRDAQQFQLPVRTCTGAPSARAAACRHHALKAPNHEYPLKSSARGGIIILAQSTHSFAATMAYQSAQASGVILHHLLPRMAGCTMNFR